MFARKDRRQDAQPLPTALEAVAQGFDKTCEWFEKVGRARYAAQIHGPGEVPYKGISLCLLASLVADEKLPPDRYYVPPFSMVTPDGILGGRPLTLDLPLDYFEIAKSYLNASPARDHCAAALSAIRSSDIVIRSLGGIEGGPRRSAAGALRSALIFPPRASKTDKMERGGLTVLSSGLKPYPLFLFSKYGLTPSPVGLIVQERVPRGHHVIFDTSTRGLIKGQKTYGVLREGQDSFSIGGSKGDDSILAFDSLPEIMKTAIFELSKLTPDNSDWGHEFEIQYDPDSKKVAILQHRFVSKSNSLKAPSSQLAVAKSSIVDGTGGRQIDVGIDLSCLFGEHIVGQYLANRWCRAHNLSYCVFAHGETLSDIRTYQETLVSLDGAAAIIETDGRRGDRGLDYFVGHLGRALTDNGTLALSTRMDAKALGNYERVSLGGLFREEDKLFLPHHLMKTFPPRNVNASIIKFPEPLFIHCDEVAGEGGIYRMN